MSWMSDVYAYFGVGIAYIRSIAGVEMMMDTVWCNLHFDSEEYTLSTLGLPPFL